MTVRFKSEYQKSYRVPRSRSVSPQRCVPLAGLRSDQMGISREPSLQRRKKFSSGFLAQSCSSLLHPPAPQRTVTEPSPHSHTTAPPAASRSRSASTKEPKPPASPGAQAGPGSPAEPEIPAGPRPAAHQGQQTAPGPAAEPGPPVEAGAAGKSVKSNHCKLNSQPQASRPLTAAPEAQQPSADEVQHALRWRAGLRSGGQRSGSQRTEHHRQFSWKKPATAASPLLTAEQVLHSSSRSVPPFKKNPVSMETEYQRSFQGLVPPTGPRLRKHLEHERVPLFHKHMTNKKRWEELEKKLHPKNDVSSSLKDETTPPPLPQVQRAHRIPEEGGATDSDASQVRELKQKALLYRRRAWGTNFSRDHLSQLVSENNALWEPTDTTDSTTPRTTLDLCHDPDSHSTSHVEALDLASRSSSSSKRSSVLGSGETNHKNKNRRKKAQTSPSSPDRRMAWEEEDEEAQTDEEEGRLPTPRLKMLPVQRTHHDLTTPATGGAILVGKLKGGDESSPSKQHRCGSAVSMAAGLAETPVKQKEAWSENNSTRLFSSGPSPHHKTSASPPSKPIRMKQATPSPVAPPLVVPPPHGIQGTLRHPDFQHNGELGLRFRELQCSRGGYGSNEDDRLSVMSWHSAASCSMASAVLERAQKRRENFWGKR